jgi:hypothetical protein
LTISNYPPPADLRYTAKDCGLYAKALSDALGQFELAGVRVANAARLSAAARLLGRVAKSGSFPTEKDELRRIANAMGDASDFFDIAQLLPKVQSRTILTQLQQALKGTLDDERRRQAAYRFQTQFWLGTVLTRGGYKPRVPETQHSHPDFIVEEGLSEYGIEVKRPENAESALELLSDGAEQLHAFNVKGLMIFDLSECVGLEVLGYVPNGKEAEARDQLLAQFRTVYSRLRERALDAKNRRLRQGFERVLGIIAIARGWSWISDEPPGLALFATAGASMFFSPVRNVVYYHSIHLVEKTIRGLNQLGYEFEQFSKVATAFDPLPFDWRL